MNTRAIAVEYRLSHWSQIIQERSNSGLSVRAYCENAGINENAYYYWLKKLREAAIEGISPNQSDQQPTSPAQPVFAELKLPPRPTLMSPATSHQDQICIETAGMRLTAGCEYPVEKLSELLREVMRICC